MLEVYYISFLATFRASSHDKSVNGMVVLFYRNNRFLVSMAPIQYKDNILLAYRFPL